ncbi:MAG: hypothetical protein IJC50_10145 [Clostridia bacterium]|nr:hypothetical protein [Clostridia bacterium]
MNQRRIYSKKYNNAIDKLADEIYSNMSETEKEELCSFRSEFIKELSGKVERNVYVPVNGYKSKRRKFIITAIKYSQKYEVDIEIIEMFGMVVAELAIGKSLILSDLKKLTEICDDVMIMNRTLDCETLLSFVLHTHKRRV